LIRNITIPLKPFYVSQKRNSYGLLCEIIAYLFDCITRQDAQRAMDNARTTPGVKTGERAVSMFCMEKASGNYQAL
jgi:hypothetical protein